MHHQVNWYGERRKQQNKTQHKSPYERHVRESNTALCGDQGSSQPGAPETGRIRRLNLTVPFTFRRLGGGLKGGFQGRLQGGFKGASRSLTLKKASESTKGASRGVKGV